MPTETKPVEPLGDLDAREALLARLRVAHRADRGSARAPRCTGTAARARRRAESAPGRSDAGSPARAPARSSSVASSTVPTRIPSAASAGHSSSRQRLVCAAGQVEDALRISASVCCGVRPSGERTDAPRDDLVLEPRDPHHEELVEDRRDDPAELHALEQRLRGIGGQLEHAPHQVELRQLAVEEGRAGGSERLLDASSQGHQHPRIMVNGGFRFGDQDRQRTRLSTARSRVCCAPMRNDRLLVAFRVLVGHPPDRRSRSSTGSSRRDRCRASSPAMRPAPAITT